MATVIFYEKPGCFNNAQQKRLLVEAGHRVLARNLLTENWTAERLRPFFGEHPVSEWFNRSAPVVRNGDVVLEELSEAEALKLMVEEPLLIRRPLMQVGERCEMGFDLRRVNGWIGLAAPTDRSDLEQCPVKAQGTPV